MRTARYEHGCFSVTENGEVTKVVVVGGRGSGGVSLATAEILDIQSMQWQPLPNPPFAMSYGIAVESVIGPYLGFSIGGSSEKRMIGLRKKEGGNGYQWDYLNGLSTSRTGLTVVNAPKSILPSC